MIEPKVGDRVGFWSTRYPGHLSHGKVIQTGGGCVMVKALRAGSCGVKKVTIMSLSDLVYNNMSDADAPADFMSVGEQVQQERVTS